MGGWALVDCVLWLIGLLVVLFIFAVVAAVVFSCWATVIINMEKGNDRDSE